MQGCALRKIEGSVVLWTCEIQGTQHEEFSWKCKIFLVTWELKWGARGHWAPTIVGEDPGNEVDWELLSEHSFAIEILMTYTIFHRGNTEVFHWNVPSIWTDTLKHFFCGLKITAMYYFTKMINLKLVALLSLRASGWGFLPATISDVNGLQLINKKPTLQVKVFAWSPFGNQLFWFRESFLQIKLPAAKF